LYKFCDFQLVDYSFLHFAFTNLIFSLMATLENLFNTIESTQIHLFLETTFNANIVYSTRFQKCYVLYERATIKNGVPASYSVSFTKFAARRLLAELPGILDKVDQYELRQAQEFANATFAATSASSSSAPADFIARDGEMFALALGTPSGLGTTASGGGRADIATGRGGARAPGAGAGVELTGDSGSSSDDVKSDAATVGRQTSAATEAVAPAQKLQPKAKSAAVRKRVRITDYADDDDDVKIIK